MEEDIRHNWLYSVVPNFGEPYAGVYLVAYCKNDRKYVTVRLHLDSLTDLVIEHYAEIPIYGCEPLQ